MKRFVFIVPEFLNVYLKKDVGTIAYFMSKNHGYESWIVGYKNEENYSYQDGVPGVRLVFLDNTGNILRDFGEFIQKNAAQIDVLAFFGLYAERNGRWIRQYRELNPDGMVYAKLDADELVKGLVCPEWYFSLVQDVLVSAESQDIVEWLNQHWPIKVEWVRNGVRFEDDYQVIPYEGKKNIILTVGRL